MKTLFLLLALILTVRIQAAITDKYVSSTAAGGGTGLTAGSPLTFTEMVTAINAGTEVGSRFNVLAGTYTRAASDALTGSGTAVSPVIIRGYSATIGDGYLGRTNTNGALILTNMPVIAYNATFRFTAANFTILESLNFTGATTTSPLITTGTDMALRGCHGANASTNASAQTLSPSSRCLLFDCDFEMTGASGGSAVIGAATAANLRVVGCRIKGGPTIGISVSTGSLILVGNTFFVGAGNQVVTTATAAGVTALFNTMVGGGADGFTFFTGTTQLQCAIGNMCTDNTGYGLDSASTTMAIVGAFNRFRANTAGAKNGATDWLAATAWGEVTSTTGDYVASGSNDYRLLTTSPAAGAAVPKSASMGALQLPASSGGGGGGSGINGSEILGIP